MDTSTRLPGHGLLAEGKPFSWSARRGEYVLHPPGWRDGLAVCSCGESSPAVLGSDADRRRWHRAHKDKIRATAATAGEEEGR